MRMKTLHIETIEAELSSALLEIEKTGEQFVLCREGVPIVDLIPHRPKSRSTPHPLLSQISINYNPVEPLTPDEWPEDA